MKQNQETFIQVVQAAPLVSIDLIIRNESGQVLLGHRLNRPAQGYWFVPGGRIRKNERIQDALARIAQAELGISPRAGKLLGAFDHLYEDNAFGLAGFGTHYVVLGYEFEIGSDVSLRKDEQHAGLRWWDTDSLLKSDDVHDNTKLYFRCDDRNGFRCGRD